MKLVLWVSAILVFWVGTVQAEPVRKDIIAEVPFLVRARTALENYRWAYELPDYCYPSEISPLTQRQIDTASVVCDLFGYRRIAKDGWKVRVATQEDLKRIVEVDAKTNVYSVPGNVDRLAEDLDKFNGTQSMEANRFYPSVFSELICEGDSEEIAAKLESATLFLREIEARFLERESRL